MIAASSTTRQYCTFRLAQYRCGIAVEAVREILKHQELAHVPLAPSVVAGLINLRGQILITLDLRTRMGFPPREAGRQPVTLVVDDSQTNTSTALLVDEIGDVIEVDPQVCTPPPLAIDGNHRELVRQVCPLDQGLLMILDADKATRI